MVSTIDGGHYRGSRSFSVSAFGWSVGFWTSLEMLENLSKLLDEWVEVFFEGYVRAKRKSRSRLQLEAELATLLRDLDEDKLRVVRDLARSLRESAERRLCVTVR